MLVIRLVIILGILIFAHELGHLLAAKLSKVKVNEFALGMGPTIFKRQYGETVYALRAFPVGGFCAMEGEDGGSDDSRSFEKKPARVRAFILGAGSFMNVVLAVLILSGMFFFSSIATTQMAEVVDGSPAQAAGIIAGDTITSIDGTQTNEWQDIVRAISETDRDTLTVGILRDGNELTIQTGIMRNPDGRIVIGIVPDTTIRLTNPITALSLGLRATYETMISMVEILRYLFTGQVEVTDLVGPVGIGFIIDDTAERGMRPLVFLVALISLNLAIVNLLPLPALDGGRLLFLVIRKITGRAITDKMEGMIHIVGIVLLLTLMLFVTWNDIMRFIFGIY